LSSYVCIGVVLRRNKNNFIGEERSKEKRLRIVISLWKGCSAC
jgi:hypothetical protein